MSQTEKKAALELLAPAGSADIGIAAIDHGADAVYIGATKFSARANAGVETKQIARLVQHAHLYYAKVYVALNTILTDEEIPHALDLIREIHDLGADALIIQDPGLLELDLPPIPLIASTQMHNHSLEKVRFLEEVGFRRAILARELSLEEIAAIRQGTSIELECFVHGALCVSYSGQCYMSQAVAGRSGNRGVCAQPCRSRYTLTDDDGNKILSGKFLLSLKDLNLANEIPSLIAAGISSFKIEGRYKDIDYVKNVTAAYSRILDDFIANHPNYRRSSSGKSETVFTPDLSKTFNRGFTRYFISGRREKIASMDTPKSIGQPIGTITGVGKNFFRTDCHDLRNGDGLCFFARDRELSGFRVERVDASRIFPSSMKGLTKGILLYRNHDIALTRLLNRESSRRRLGLVMDFKQENNSICLTAMDEDGNRAKLICDVAYEQPRDSAMALEQVEKHLTSTGNTPFNVTELTVSHRLGFLPIRLLNGVKRRVLEDLLRIRIDRYPRATAALVRNSVSYPEKRIDFRANVLNQHAMRFYKRHGAHVVESAFESLEGVGGKEVMKTKYCLLYELGECGKSRYAGCRLKEPLKISDGHNAYLLKFDCESCTMSLIFVGRKESSGKYLNQSYLERTEG